MKQDTLSIHFIRGFGLAGSLAIVFLVSLAPIERARPFAPFALLGAVIVGAALGKIAFLVRSGELRKLNVILLPSGLVASAAVAMLVLNTFHADLVTPRPIPTPTSPVHAQQDVAAELQTATRTGAVVAGNEDAVITVDGNVVTGSANLRIGSPEPAHAPAYSAKEVIAFGHCIDQCPNVDGTKRSDCVDSCWRSYKQAEHSATADRSDARVEPGVLRGDQIQLP